MEEGPGGELAGGGRIPRRKGREDVAGTARCRDVHVHEEDEARACSDPSKWIDVHLHGKVRNVGTEFSC